MKKKSNFVLTFVIHVLANVEISVTYKKKKSLKKSKTRRKRIT